MTDSAAILERLRAQQDAMQSLFSAVESGLADVVGGIEKTNEVLSALGAIEAAMADMTAAIERDSTRLAIDKLTEAVATMHQREMPAPNITVEANMPAPVVQMMPHDMTGATWEVRLPGKARGDAERVMTITRTS